MKLFRGITMHPDVRLGKPCISDCRMDVATIGGFLAVGETIGTVAADYALRSEHVRRAFGYVPHVMAHVRAESGGLVFDLVRERRRSGNAVVGQFEIG